MDTSEEPTRDDADFSDLDKGLEHDSISQEDEDGHLNLDAIRKAMSHVKDDIQMLEDDPSGPRRRGGRRVSIVIDQPSHDSDDEETDDVNMGQDDEQELYQQRYIQTMCTDKKQIMCIEKSIFV
jgi:hypothetical protein